MILITALLILHWVGDFRLQTMRMALNKANWNKTAEGFYAIFYHVLTYTGTMAVGLTPLIVLGWVPVLNPYSWMGFFLVTFGTHLATDAVTSKGTSKNWFVHLRRGMIELDQTKRSRFFNIIGIDQTIHFLCLFWAAYAIGALKW